MRYLLDTHAAIWLLEGSSKLGKKARRALGAGTNNPIAISGVSLLEIAMLHRRGIIDLVPDTRRGLEAFAQHLAVLPIDSQIAADAVDVALPQRDPFDRVIVATARVHGCTLVTKDSNIIDANVVSTLW